MAKETTEKSDVECNFYQSAEDVPDRRELRSEENYLMVFSDLLLEKQKTYVNRIISEEDSNVDCFHLAQNYFKLPRKQSERTRISYGCFTKI